MIRVRRLWPAVLAALIVLVVSTVAHAERGPFVLTDGEAFSVDLAAPSACFLLPSAFRDRVPCKGVDPTNVASARFEKGTILAMSLVPVGEAKRKSLVGLIRIDMKEGAPSSKKLERFAHEFQESMQRPLGPAGTVRAPEATRRQRGELTIVRLKTGVDGLPPGDPRALVLEYQVTAIFFAVDAGYTLSVGGTKADSEAIDSLLDELEATVTVAKPAPVRYGDNETVAGILGRISAWVLLALLVLASVLWDRRRRKRRETPPNRRRKKKRKKPTVPTAVADEGGPDVGP